MLKERQHGLRDRDGAYIIRTHGRLKGCDADLARWAVARVCYGSVVDEKVESAELVADGLRCGCGSLRRLEIDMNEVDIETFRLKLYGSLLA